MIKTTTLNKIGMAKNWGSPIPELFDEDWGLRALQLNIINIWIPQLLYIHKRLDSEPGGSARCWETLDHEKSSYIHKQFL